MHYLMYSSESSHGTAWPPSEMKRLRFRKTQEYQRYQAYLRDTAGPVPDPHHITICGAAELFDVL